MYCRIFKPVKSSAISYTNVFFFFLAVLLQVLNFLGLFCLVQAFEGVCVNSRHPEPLRRETRVCSAQHGAFPVDPVASSGFGGSAAIQIRIPGSPTSDDNTTIVALFAKTWGPISRHTLEQSIEN